MSVNYKKLFNPYEKIIKSDISEIDEILEEEEFLFIISKKIIQYRKEKNITQNQLAKELNVNQAMISKLESGKYNPTFKQIHKLSRKITGSSKLYIEILQEIIDSLKEFSEIQVKYEMYNKMELQYTEKENKVIYIKDYKFKGDNEDGKYQSKYTIYG